MNPLRLALLGTSPKGGGFIGFLLGFAVKRNAPKGEPYIASPSGGGGPRQRVGEGQTVSNPIQPS